MNRKFIMARPKKNPDFVMKTCPTCQLQFSVVCRKKHQVYCSKSCAQKNPSTILKMVASQKNTSMKKYGVDHPMKNSEVVKNFKSSMVEKYGVSSALKSKEFFNKAKLTRLKRYGDENYNNLEKRRITSKEKYGEINYTMTDEYKTNRKMSTLEKYGVEHTSKSIGYRDAHFRNMFEQFSSGSRFSNFDIQFTYEDYIGTHLRKYPFKCKRCGDVRFHSISSGLDLNCIHCDKQSVSAFQTEVYLFIKTLMNCDSNIILDDRTVLYPQELDVFIPSLNIGIECDGLFWHSESSGGKNKLYHLNKTKKCMKKGVRLIHIFENVWRDKRQIVESTIRSILGKLDRKIFAKQCKVKHIENKIFSKFLEENHLQGNDKSKIKIGLYLGEELVSVMSFCNSRFDKNYQYELSRFCSKLNTSVIGGATKLFSFFIKTYNPRSIISYCDRRFFGGEVYSKLGFTFIGHTPPSQNIVVNNYKNTITRMGLTKTRMKRLFESYDEAKSLKDNILNLGFDRIWDCGHSKWIFTSSK